MKIVAFKLSTGTSITFFLSFHKPKCLLTTFFYPRQKVSGFPVTSSVPELCSNRCSCSLFSSLYTLIFFACNKNTSSNKRKSLERYKIKIVHDKFLIDKNSYFTNILLQSKQKGQAHQVFYNLNINFL